jgi:hypothetical protein
MIESVLPKLRVSTVMPSDRGDVRILVSPQRGEPLAPKQESETQPQSSPTPEPIEND